MKKDKKEQSNKAKGKMAALKELHGIASQMMGDDFSELQKVTIAAKDKKGLTKGLDKAKELLSKKK